MRPELCATEPKPEPKQNPINVMIGKINGELQEARIITNNSRCKLDGSTVPAPDEAKPSPTILAGLPDLLSLAIALRAQAENINTLL